MAGLNLLRNVRRGVNGLSGVSYVAIRFIHNKEKRRMNEKATLKNVADGRLVAVENELKILLALHRFGWLPTRHLHAYVWPESAAPRMAQRTLERLREAGEVLHKRGRDGAVVYALTALGAKRLRKVYGIDASSVKDIARRIERNYEHRCTANEVAIWWSQHERCAGFETEHEVSSGRALLRKKQAGFAKKEGKVPDALLFANAPAGVDADVVTIWVEAEGGHKNIAKQRHMVSELAYIVGYGGTSHEERRLRPDGLVVYEVQLALVACPTLAHEHRLVRTMLEFLFDANKRFNHYPTDRILKSVQVWRPGEVAADDKTESLFDILARRKDLQEFERRLRRS